MLRRWLRSNELKGYLFISPWLVGFALFTVYAMYKVVHFSFTEYDVFDPPRWIGLQNYSRMFFEDHLFKTSLYNTAYYTLFSVPLGICAAFALAALLNAPMRFRSLFRAIFYVPAVVPAVASAILWLWIFRPTDGLLNIVLRYLGITGPNWLSSIQWSKPALIIMSLWGVGGTMIIFLAGLQDVPRELYEAAELDGAGAWKRFRYVTLPMMTPTIFFALVMGVINSFQVFTNALIMTNGGPAYSTLFYVLYLYDNAFRYFQMGYASALALVLFVIILIFTLLIVRSSDRWVFYGR